MAPRRITVSDAQFAPVTPAAFAVVPWLAGFGAVLAALAGRLSADALLACAGPGLLGLALAFSSRRDGEQYVMRLCVAGLMLPILMLFWASDRVPGWQLVLLSLLVAAVFVAGIVWMASSMTRLAPSPGSTAIEPARLDRRIVELARHLGLSAVADAAGGWRIDLSPLSPAGHAQLLRLVPDAARGEVIALERAGATDAAPRDAAEASMRSPADPAFDPTRPDAQRVAYSSVQATQLTPERLARVQLELDEHGQIVRADLPRPVDHRDAVALFALLVTASGHAWQPRCFDRRPARPAGQGVSA